MSDQEPPNAARLEKFRPFAELISSLTFLTRLPIPFARTLDLPPLTQSMRLFAVAGAIIGALNGLVLVGLQALNLPSLLCAALTCMFGLLITGGLHEDGLADSADGLFGGKTREDRLLIMRDSRIGSYGAMAVLTCLLARVASYEALLGFGAISCIAVMAAVGAFSRAMVVDLMWATKSARSDGLSVLAGRPGRNSALLAIFTGGGLALAAGLNLRPESGVVAVLGAAAVTGLMRRYAMRQIGGQTGDICGATQVLVEITMFVIFLAMIG